MMWPCARSALLLAAATAAILLVDLVKSDSPATGSSNSVEIPHFDVEPPALVEFANTIGARVPCQVSGIPQPQTAWQLVDGTLLTGAVGLRDVSPDGTLIFHPFKAEDFRQDVHVVRYRCAASSALGTVISRDVRVKAVIKQRYEIYVYDTYAIKGNAAVLKCHVPNFLKDYVSVIAWLRDDRYVINNTDFGSDQPYVILPDGQLYIRKTEESDHGSNYKCRILHRLTNETKLSSTQGKLFVSEAQTNLPPRFIATPKEDFTATKGTTVVLPCVSQGNPVPTIRWYRKSSSGRLEPFEMTHVSGALVLSSSTLADDGVYVCAATNEISQEKTETILRISEPLRVSVNPKKLLSEIGSSAQFSCDLLGVPLGSIIWVKDGKLIENDDSVITTQKSLSISSVATKHKGIYQCIGKNEFMTSHSESILNLGDTPPEFKSVFAELELRPGSSFSLKCAVSGTPLPEITWLLDGAALLGKDRMQHVDSTVISWLNISNIRSEDGGVYTCVAKNKAGIILHSSRINVYGQLTARSSTKISVISGKTVNLICPVYGHPIERVLWKKGGLILPENHRQTEWSNGTLSILNVHKSYDNGRYECQASNSEGESAKGTVELSVMVPPKIVPFFFQEDLVREGMRARLQCVVSEGDSPMSIRWTKDGRAPPSSLGIVIRDIDEFSSILAISSVSSRHNGHYTCIASNGAAVASHTTVLSVNVPPRWILMPQNITAIRNRPLSADCQADGFPKPTIVWKKVLGLRRNDEQKLMITNPNITIHLNGTMHFHKVKLEDEGFYFCYASNGVGLELSKTMFVRVQAPVYFKITDTTQKTNIGTAALLQCEAYGDPPITFRWAKDMYDITTEGTQSKFQAKIFNDTAKEATTATLLIQDVLNSDAGKYSCIAKNKYGNSTTVITLTVQEPPMSPEIISLKNLGNRSVEIYWNQPSDGNAPILNYTLQYKRKQDSWASRSTSLTYQANTFKALVGELQPATVYEFRVAAQNEIGLGQYCNVVTVVMGEEAPTGTPQQVEVEAVDPQTLRISWKPPKKSMWNGVIRGYYVGYKEHGSLLAYSFTTLEVPEDYTEDLIYQLTNLNMYTKYSIVVQAYNKGGRGPSSEEVIIMTSEDIPSEAPRSIRCSSLSSRSVYVIWESPPSNAIHGILRGYKVVYKPLEQWHDGSSKTNTTTVSRITLSGLEVDTNYSIQVLAFTKLGDGVKSDPVFCKTYEDVPGSPEAIKALPVSGDAVLVSWKPPARPNGAITKYNVYYTPLGQGEEHKDFANTEGLEGVGVQTMESDLQYYELKGLQHDTKYAFWVTAVSSIGEGPISTVVTQEPANKDVPAMTASFDEVIKSHWKRDLVMPCRGVGIPPPSRKWFQQNRLVKENERVVIRFDGTLVIKKPNSEDSGNYTCRIKNKLGTAEVHYSVNVVVPPGSPTLDVLSKSLSSVRLRWRPGPDGGDAIQGYFIHFKRDGGQWEKKELSADITTHTLEKLSCGAAYQLYVEAFNNVGTGSGSETLTVTTHGESFQLPPKESLIQEGATFVTIHIDSWPSTGCPVQSLQVEYKQLTASEWTTVSNNIKPSQKKLVIPKLNTGTWYVLRITAFTSGDDFNIGEYIFSTQTAVGGIVSPDINQMEEKVIMYHLDPWIFIPVVGLIIVCIITSVVIFVYFKRRPRRKQPDDWTQYAGTLARAHELGVSVESFVRLPKSCNTATIARNGTMWRRGNEPNPYATIRLPEYCSEMTVMRERRGSGPSRVVQQVPVINTDAGWVAVGSNTGGIANPFEHPQLWPEAYGTIPAGNDVYGIPEQYSCRSKPSDVRSQQAETNFVASEPVGAKAKPTESVVAAEMHVVEDTREDKATMSVERKDAEVGEDAWLLDKSDSSK